MLGKLHRLLPWRLHAAPDPTHAPGAADAADQRDAILRGIYAQNRGLHEPPRPAQPARAPRRARRWRLAVPLAMLVTLTGAQVLHAWPTSSQPLLALLAPATGGATPAATPAQPPPPVATPRAAVPPAPPVAPAELPPAAFAPVEIADIAPAVSGKENLKSLFGLSVRTIVIDAGHGGHDPGALGTMGAQEKDITLDVAKRLRDKLAQNKEYRILMVRDEDNFVPLRERANFANSHETDLFVSIHVNYLPSTSVNAVETYYFGRHEDARGRKLAERENEGSDYALSEFEGVLRNVQDTIKHQESQTLAHSIQGSLLANMREKRERVRDHGVRTAPFVVLLGVKAPSVLVEIGSLSSKEAEKNLGRERYRDEIATYVAAGITQYLNEHTREERIHDKDQGRVAKRQ